jgi:hypothetical protein
MFYWFGEGFFCVPSQTAQTRPKSPTIDSKLLGPLVEIQSLAAKGKRGVSAKDTKQADGYSDRKGEYKTLGRDSLGLSN